VAGQCAILYINAGASAETHATALRALGFDVVETGDVPARDSLANYHAIVVRIKNGPPLTHVATRLRAAPRFGRRVLIGLVPASMTTRERREAVHCGFDVVLPEQSSARDIAASILSRLRRYPEHRCVLRSHSNRRRAAA
jgi:methylmalonyl-CoA mutase cobalamin-binding subunit